MNLDKSKWKKVRFGDVVFEKKITVDAKNCDLERYIAGEHMASEDLHLRNWGIIGDDYLGPAFYRKFEKGDILYGSRRTYLKKVAIADFDGVTANTTFVLRENTDLVVPGFIPFLMLSDIFTEHSVRNSKGSVNPYINYKDIAQFQFHLPPKDQQARLAELLWAGDAVVEGYFKMMDTIDNLLVILRETEICNPGIQRVKFRKILRDIIAGRSLNGVNEPVVNQEKGVLKVSAVGGEGFVYNENKRLIEQNQFLSQFSVKKGDLLITRANTRELVGRVCLVESDYPNLMLSDKTLKLELNTEVSEKLYYLEVLRSKEVRSQIEGTATGTGGAMKNISQDEIRNLMVPSPDVKKQQLLSQKVKTLEATKKKLNNSIECQRAAVRNLLNQIFTP
jgi:restriction endonuclease S subunit